ncbi:hypothetical protein F4779DRAFT_567192 [Xylariaceae sp. FL0662B]|nr:hypothetical protein F4779DRAFT_567192 [Xylariaceae sp. FL0662B]
MFARPARHAAAPIRVSTARRPTMPISPRPWARFSSTQAPSAYGQFYRTFGRPIAKAFLIAIFTYQVAYYFWVRLEQKEIKSEMRATISELEARIEQLEKARKR